MAEIKIKNVSKKFGKVTAVNNVTLTIHDKEFAVLLGPSGCGKTTLLRCIAGLEQVDQGRIYIGEEDVTDLSPRDRKIAMVFQNYAVFPHMTVFDNIGFGPLMHHVPKPEIKERVVSIAEMLHIEDLLERFPAQLSGGQRQRVALARALAVQAKVILMDEPLSNLDALLRLEMRAELKHLLDELETTVVYVTHDQIEALSLGDRIIVMRTGIFQQIDVPMQVYDHPATFFIGGFIGNPPMNFLNASVMDSGAKVMVNEVEFKLPARVISYLKKEKKKNVWMGIRSENIEPLHTPDKNALHANILVVEPLGSHLLITVKAGEDMLKVYAHPDSNYKTGQDIWLKPIAKKIRWIDKKTEKAL